MPKNYMTEPNLRHFEGEGYSFDYPVFENWDVVVNKTEMKFIPKLYSNTKELLVLVTVKKIMRKVSADYWPSKPKNSNNVHYASNISPGIARIVFRTNNAAIEITIPLKMTAHEFSGEKIYQMILDSFKVNNSATPNKEH